MLNTSDFIFIFFFCQAEDGIRDWSVNGVQTCALPIYGKLCGLSALSLAERVPALLELLGLTPHREKRLREFSKGMLQRIGLAQALIHEPELIFLDEPTSGLDPMGRRLVRDVIRAQRERGATVFLNSHW